MLLAELEVFHSRPIAPTRRVALGTTVLPTAPAPGFGGILLAGIASHFVPEVDEDLLGELDHLMVQLEAGRRIPQPRLRHRFQDDRIGLAKCRHRLIGTGEELRFELDDRGSPAPNVLATVYAAGRLAPDVRPEVFGALRRGLHWRGDLGPTFIDHVSGSRATTTWSSFGGRDPVVWALGVFGFPSAAGRLAIQARFRDLLRDAHPDHGGDAAEAAARIRELTEARRILLHG